MKKNLSLAFAGLLLIKICSFQAQSQNFQKAYDLYSNLGLTEERDRISDRITYAGRSKIQEAAEQAEANGNSALAAKEWDEAIPQYQYALDLYTELALPDEQARLSDLISHTQRQGPYRQP